MPRRYSPEEDAVLLPYLAEVCDCWDELLPRLNRRTRWGAERRLLRLRRAHGTLWRVNQSEYQRRRAATLPRQNGSFARC